MDYEVLNNALSANLMKLITLGGSINPYVGAAVGVLGGIAMIYFAIQAAKQRWQKRKKKAGEVIAGTGKEQQSAKKVQDGVDDFLDD